MDLKRPAALQGVRPTVAFVCALATTAVGVVGMAPYFQSRAVWSAVQASHGLSYPLALALLISGTALMSLALSRARLGRWLSAASALVAVLLGAGFVDGLRALLLRLPAWEIPLGETAFASPQAVLCLLMGAGALCLMSFRSTALSSRRGLLACGGAAFVIALGSSGLVGSLLGLDSLGRWRAWSPLAPDAAVGMLFLGAGIWLSAWLAIVGDATAYRRALPITAGIFLSTVTYLAWHTIAADERDSLEARHQAQADELREDLAARLELQLAPLVRMANAWEKRGRPQRQRWESEAHIYVRHFPALEVLQWIDDRGEIRWVAHPSGERTEAQEKFAHRPVAGQRDAIKLAREMRRAQIFRFGTGDDLFYEFYLPLHAGSYFDGVLLGRYRASRLFETAASDGLAALPFVVRDGDDIVYSHASRRLSEAKLSLPFSVYGHVWELAVSVHEPADTRSLSPGVALALGLTLTLLGIVLAVAFQSARQRAEERERGALALAESEARLRRQAQELEQARIASDERLKAQSDFLEATRRELGMLLDQVTGSAEKLLSTKLSARQREHVRGLLGWSAPLRLVLDDLDDFQRAQAGALRLSRDDFELRGVVEEIEKMFADAAKSRGIELRAHIDSNVPDKLRGDRARIKRVLAHVFDVALARLTSGQAVLHVSATERSPSDLGLRFEWQVQGLFTRPTDGEAPVADVEQLARSVAGRLIRLMDGDLGTAHAGPDRRTVWLTLFVERAMTPQETVETEGDGESLADKKQRVARAIAEHVSALRQAVILEDWRTCAEHASKLSRICVKLGFAEAAAASSELAGLSGPIPSPRALMLLKRIETDFEQAKQNRRRELVRRTAKSRVA